MELTLIQKKIFVIRGHRVMLDRDLAEMYGVETRVLMQAVKRNAERFPFDFMFQLNKQGSESLRSQIVTLKRGQHSKYLPYAFTEHGITMLSGVLKKHIGELELKFNRKIENIHDIINHLLEKPIEEKSKPRKPIGFRIQKNKKSKS